VGGESLQAAEAAIVASGVDLDYEGSESGRPEGLGGRFCDLSQVAQQARSAYGVFGL
jgi:hypothetical protein